MTLSFGNNNIVNKFKLIESGLSYKWLNQIQKM